MHPDGGTWGVVGESVMTNEIEENFEALFKISDETGIPVFVSLHQFLARIGKGADVHENYHP